MKKAATWLFCAFMASPIVMGMVAAVYLLFRDGGWPEMFAVAWTLGAIGWIVWEKLSD